MATSKQKLRSVHVQKTIDIEVTPVPFVPFESLRNLDLEALARAPRAVVELGQIETECCRRTARALIKKGYVTEVRLDPCGAKGKPAPIDRDFAKLIAQADAKLRGKGGGGVKLPIPVAKFFARKGVIGVDIPASWTCYRICPTLFGKQIFCMTCCVTTLADKSKIFDCGAFHTN